MPNSILPYFFVSHEDIKNIKRYKVNIAAFNSRFRETVELKKKLTAPADKTSASLSPINRQQFFNSNNNFISKQTLNDAKNTLAASLNSHNNKMIEYAPRQKNFSSNGAKHYYNSNNISDKASQQNELFRRTAASNEELLRIITEMNYRQKQQNNKTKNIIQL